MWKHLFFAALAAVVLFDAVPVFWGEYCRHGAEWIERYRFQREHSHLAAEYPTFMGAVLKDTVDFVATGSLTHALNHMWHNMAATQWLRYIVGGAGKLAYDSLIRRLLSPQGYVETAMLLIAVLLLGYGGFLLATNYILVKGRTRVQVANLERKQAKYAHKARSAAQRPKDSTVAAGDDMGAWIDRVATATARPEHA